MFAKKKRLKKLLDKLYFNSLYKNKLKKKITEYKRILLFFYLDDF